MDDLMQKLVKSKMIMDKSDNIKRGTIDASLPSTMVQNFDVPNAKYNIPQEFLQEGSGSPQPLLSSVPNTKPVGVPSVDAIKNSKLPDEIKKLMIEHPIAQQQVQGQTISDDIIEKASRLMKSESSNNYIPESVKQKSQPTQLTSNTQIDYNLIKRMIREAVDEALQENGLMVENTEKANEMLSFKVGKHVFEGKITKIKKIV